MSHNCHMHMGPIHNSYWVGSSCSVVDVRRCGHTHMIVTMLVVILVVNQIAKRPVILCCDKCAVTSNCKHAVFLQKLQQFAFCNATFAVKEYRKRYPWPRIPNRCVFTCVHQCLWEKGSFPSVTHHAEHQVQQVWRKMKTLLTSHSKNHALLHEEFLPASVFCVRGSGECYTQQDCVHRYPVHSASWTCQHGLAGWNSATGLILTPIWFITFCSPTKPQFTHDGINNTRYSH